ncbi:hypothetical protein II906_03665 [bacterium]|nr:hypothetical protein [bacterium]
MNLLTNRVNIPKTIEENKQSAPPPVETKPAVLDYKPDIIDICSDKIISNHDIKDTVTMPRAIFKGYLCFTAGTAINAMASLIKKEKVSAAMQIIGSAIAILGTFNFVKPFLAANKTKNLTEEKK